MGKTCDLHMHSKDQFDSDNAADKVCSREKELGAKAVALTQHGVASQIESFKKAAKKYGLKFIPGIEAYYSALEKMFHLIILAMDDTGWKAICMAITEGQNKSGQAVMTEEILRRHFGPGSIGHGHVLATSACINGVIAGVLRSNEAIEKEIKKVERRMQKAVRNAPGNDALEALDEDILVLQDREREKAEKLEKAKALASMKFKQREKAVSKLSGEAAEAAAKELENDKNLSKEAAESLPDLKKELEAIKRRIAAMNKEKKELIGVIEKRDRYLSEIEEMRAGIEDEIVIEERAEEEFRRFIGIFGEGNFYAEVQNHGIDTEAAVYPKIAKLARKLGVPIVATNDVHTIDNSEDELLRRRMLRALRFEQWQDDQPGDDQLYIKTDEELEEWLRRILPEDVVKEAMGNIMAIVDRCDVRFETENHYPKFIPKNGQSTEEFFDDLVERGLKTLFPDGLPEGYRERVEREKEIMKTMGYVDYHLVVRDFTQYASLYDYIPPDRIKDAPIDPAELEEWKKKNGYTKKTGLSNGTGRGSAVGSLVCDALKITHLDPIKYDLYFERFLNPERVSMPDIDSDISRSVRQRVIEYVKQKYGENCVCGIMTQNAQAPRGAIRNAAKCYGLFKNKDDKKDNGAKRFLSLADQIAKKVPMEPGISFDSRTGSGVTVYQSLRSEYMENEDALEIIRWAKVFEGCFTAYGAHAAGIVITDGTPVSEIIPLRWNDKLGIYTTQCNMVEVEEAGMLKFDVLGLKTVDIINDCLWQLEKEGIHVDIYSIPLEDKKVYREIFAKGQTDSVFQFESSGMKQMLKRFKPECFEDLILLVSMFRPGPLQYLDGVIDVKNGVKPLEFLDEKLRPILGTTYGAISYQEQVMRIFQELAGYSLGGADLVRRAMSKKKLSVLEKERHAFVYGDPERHIAGCVNNGIPEHVANTLFDQMTEFAKYAFNKSHAAAYAYNAYVTGYLKYHYPAEFLMSAMRWAEKTQRKDPIPGLMAEAKAMGIEVRQPDINMSGAKFTVEDGRILFGLGAVKSVGMSADIILKERNMNGPFRSLHDFYRRCSVNKGAVQNLIAAGAFDSFGTNRLAMKMSVEQFKKAADDVRKKESFIRTAEAMLPYVDSIDTDEKIKEQQKALGLAVELKEVTTRAKLEKRIVNAKKAVKSLKERFESLRVDASAREDRSERMREEKELIGAYVTCHPLDEYENGEETASIRQIRDISAETDRIFGVVGDVQIKKRKKDGKPMAFVTLEDKSGSIRVNFFTAVYGDCSEVLKPGNVIIVTGKAKEEEVFVPNAGDADEGFDEGEREKEFVFTARNAYLARKRKEKCLYVVSSYAVFHIFEEKTFREEYGDENGNPLLIYDRSMKELREASYRISRDALEDGVVELV